MVARWDALLLATVLAGGSMLIENSHRLDTGAPDEVVATTACGNDQAAARYGWNGRVPTDGDDGSDSSTDADTTQASSVCPAE